MTKRAVVMTGIGTISAAGLENESFWEALDTGDRLARPVTAFDASGFVTDQGCEVPGYDVRQHVPKSYRKSTKVMARDSELAVIAALAATRDAGFVTRGNRDDESVALTCAPERLGCQIGAGLIAAETPEMSAAMTTARADDDAGLLDLKKWGGEGGSGMDALTPLWLLKYLPNMLACHVTIIHGAEGPSNTITCAEASGLLSLGESARVIQRGDADACFSGGAESKLNYMGMVRMQLLDRLAPTPERALPYDPGSAGMILGEGGAIFILEDQQHASQRGARAYCRVAGFGSSHSKIMYDDAEGDLGVRYAAENALEDAGIKPEDVDAVFPLASGTRRLDSAERGGLEAVLGDHLPRIPVIDISSIVGNCIAGASALQTACAALSVHRGGVPAGAVNAVLGSGGVPDGPVKRALVLTPALGGQNAAMVLEAVT